MTAPIVPPATIGVLGGGQLGRYTIVAARLMGYGTVVLDPDPAAPAGRVADEHVVAPYDDGDAQDRLAETCAVVTTEFENPPAAALERLARDVVVAPSAAAVAVAQDRIAEKRFLSELGVPCAPWAAAGPGGMEVGMAVGFPAIVKTARLGYDGKGQLAVDDATVMGAALAEVGVACVVEQRVPLDVEVSVIVARGADGRHVTYPIAENRHARGILDMSVVPARISPMLANEAVALAQRIAEALEYVGVLAVEMFVVDEDGRQALLVNEIAPRVHNSGHWTIDGATVSQFEQHVRAVAGWPLAKPLRHGRIEMTNLIGAEVEDYARWLTVPGASVHLYGKGAPRPGRKMGHVTQVFPTSRA